jgi:WhiB family redox-sensing transcriptional regulator
MARDDPAVEDRADDWRLRAACLPFDSELFFPDRAAYRNQAVARAKAVCQKCPVREACLRAAMDGREKLGIWGGLTPEERTKLRRRERRVAMNAVAAGERTASSRAADVDRPTREQIRRGVAAGRQRLGATRG